MKRLKTICRLTFLAIILFLAAPVETSSEATENTQSKPLNQESQLSPDDWKIEIDEKKSLNDFEFIQKNLDSSNLADNSQSLLILGIILLVLSCTGVIFFSLCMYKLLGKPPQKRTATREGARHK